MHLRSRHAPPFPPPSHRRAANTKVNKVIQQFGTDDTTATIGGLHFLKGDPSYSTLTCLSSTCTAYSLQSEHFQRMLATSPAVATDVVYSLQRQVRQMGKPKQRTPILRQKQTTAPIVATSVAATVESFYRSALGAYINAHLTGKPVAKLFPDMHVQIPMRVVYINGTKGSRAWLNNNVDPKEYSYPMIVSTAILLTPGLLMTPMSSVLEAANAGHVNPEPLAKRWIRGISARAVREIIFAIGLNQAADFCEERARPCLFLFRSVNHITCWRFNRSHYSSFLLSGAGAGAAAADAKHDWLADRRRVGRLLLACAAQPVGAEADEPVNVLHGTL
jgi:hypothetical protein